MTLQNDAADVAIKITPPIVLTAWTMWGFTLTEWSAITVIFYTLLMTTFLLMDRFKKWKKENKVRTQC